MAQGGELKKGSFEIQPGSIPISELSTTFRELLKEGKHEFLIDGGYKECIKRMDNGEIKIGRILALVRSFEHHKHRELDGSTTDYVIARLGQLMLRPLTNEKAKKKLKEMGQPIRDFAYIHTAVYLGKGSDGKHYAIENAGSSDRETEGAWLKLSDIESFFNDLLFDHSKFLVIKPDKAHTTAYRAMAAYFHQFKYKFSGFGFNCETFTSTCAGLRINEDEVDVAIEAASNIVLFEEEDTEMNPFQRVLKERLDVSRVRQGAIEHAANQRTYYVEGLRLLFWEHQSAIDSGSYVLGTNEAGKVCIIKTPSN